MKRITKTTLTLAAAAFLAATSQADVINIDFNTNIGVPTLAPYAGASANGPIASASVWNQFTLSSPPNGQSMNKLLDHFGTVTAVNVAFGTGWAGSYNNGIPNNLQADRAYTSGGGTGTFTVSGLIPGGTYNLALFVDDNDTGSIATDFTIGATTMMAFGGSAGTNVDGPLTFTAGETHALFSGITASAGGDITISTTQAAGSTFGSFPGLQIEGSFIPFTDTDPTLIGTDPADDATVGVAVGQNLVMTFDKTVQAGTSGTIALWKTSPDTLVESFDVTSPTGLTFGGTSVTINPAADLVVGVEYYVLIDADAIVDTSSNGFAGITVIGDWSFSPDATPPAVGTIDSPANEATSVRVGGNLSLTFDEDVQKGSGSIVIRRFDDDSVVDTIDVASVSVSITGGQVTFAPTADLPAGTQLYVEIGAGAFQDVSGNAFGGITGSAAWSFTTSASQAEVINIDFNTNIGAESTLLPYAGASANGPIASGSVWNQFTLSSPPNEQSMNNLLDDSGTETAVNVAFGTGWTGSYNNRTPNNLQADRAYTSGGGTGTFTVSGLTPGGTYNLALFVDNNSSGSIATDFTIGDTTMMAFGGSAGTDVNGPLTFTAGETHALFSGISASVDGDITISTTQAAGSTFGSFPGLQIEGSFGPETGVAITEITSVGGGTWQLTIKGEPNTAYEFRSSTTLDFNPGMLVDPLAAGVPAVGTINGTSLTTGGSGDGTVRVMLAGLRNFVRAQDVPPPPPLLEENFDGVAGPGLPAGWSTGAGATAWEVGDPFGGPAGGPQAAVSALNCAGTGITTDYAAATTYSLVSPAFAVPAGGATLSFQQFIDTDLAGDEGAIRILDADNADALIEEMDPPGIIEAIATGWSAESFPLPASALGMNIKIEFRFVTNDNTQEWAGFYVDDVLVEAN